MRIAERVHYKPDENMPPEMENATTPEKVSMLLESNGYAFMPNKGVNYSFMNKSTVEIKKE